MSNIQEDLIIIVVLPDDFRQRPEYSMKSDLERAVAILYKRAEIQGYVPVGHVQFKRITVFVNGEPTEHEAVRVRLNVVPKEQASTGDIDKVATP